MEASLGYQDRMHQSTSIGVQFLIIAIGSVALFDCSRSEPPAPPAAPVAAPAGQARPEPSVRPSVTTDASTPPMRHDRTGDPTAAASEAGEDEPASNVIVAGRSAWNAVTRIHVGDGPFAAVLNEERMLRENRITMRAITDPSVAAFYSIATQTQPCYTDNNNRGSIEVNCDVEVTRIESPTVEDGGAPPSVPSLSVSCVTGSGATVLFGAQETAPRVVTSPSTTMPGSKVMVRVGSLWSCWQRDGTTLRFGVAPIQRRTVRRSDYY